MLFLSFGHVVFLCIYSLTAVASYAHPPPQRPFPTILAPSPFVPHESPFHTPSDASSVDHLPHDLADLNSQCGRRGDALKVFLSGPFHGRARVAANLERAYDVANRPGRVVEGEEERCGRGESGVVAVFAGLFLLLLWTCGGD